MNHARQFYINGQWVDPISDETLAVINPATEETIETISMGGPEDVDAAVAAARAAFETFSLTTREERLALLDRDHLPPERHHGIGSRRHVAPPAATARSPSPRVRRRSTR